MTGLEYEIDYKSAMARFDELNRRLIARAPLRGTHRAPVYGRIVAEVRAVRAHPDLPVGFRAAPGERYVRVQRFPSLAEVARWVPGESGPLTADTEWLNVQRCVSHHMFPLDGGVAFLRGLGRFIQDTAQHVGRQLAEHLDREHLVAVSDVRTGEIQVMVR